MVEEQKIGCVSTSPGNDEDKPSRSLLPAHRKRTARLGIPLTPAEYARCREAAVKAELTLADWGRQACELALKQQENFVITES